MNNYLKVLLYLKKYEGDGQYHEIESLFPNLSIKQQEAIFRELEGEDFIKLTGREQRFDNFIFEVNHFTGQSKITESPLNALNDLPPKPFSAKLTFKGSKYLKEELEMQNSGKYNINIGNSSTANLILESDNAVIHNSSQVHEQIKEIVDTIKKDETLSDAKKSEAIAVFQKAENELSTTRKISKLTLREILATGSDISTIGTAVAALAQLVM